MPRHARAYRQGDLDGLCGLYSIVNAVCYVLRLRDEQCQQLFEKLIKALEQDCCHLHRHLLWGMSFRQLGRLVAAVSSCRLKGQKLTFAARPLRLKREQRTLPHLWAALNEELGPTCVAIIGLSGVDDHWCVIHKVTPKTLWLLDSSGQTRIYRSRCTVRSSRTRYCLEAGEILLIKR
jgi:hypothetical protein